MPKYLAKRDTWLSHESRMVREGDEFVTEFPKVNGKPMRLSDNLEMVKDKADKPAADDQPAEEPGALV